MSRRPWHSGSEPTGDPDTLHSIAKRIGDPPDRPVRIDQHKIEAHPIRAPIRIVRQHDLGGGDQTSLLPRRQGRGRLGQSRPRLDLDNREQSIPFRYKIDLAGRRPQPPGVHDPAVANQRGLGRRFRGQTAILRFPASSRSIRHGVRMTEER